MTAIAPHLAPAVLWTAVLLCVAAPVLLALFGRGKRWRGALLAVAALLLCICIGDVIAIQHETDYGRNAAYLSNAGYAKALGVDSFQYTAFIDAYGTPQSIQEDPDGFVLMQYPGFSLRCDHGQGGDFNLVSVRILDPAFRFGRLRIGIGSTRFCVRLAYLIDPRLKEEEWHYREIADDAFFGEDWSQLLFRYDAQGRVEMMQYGVPAF